MANTVKIRYGSGVPIAADFAGNNLVVDENNLDLYFLDSLGNVQLLAGQGFSEGNFLRKSQNLSDLNNIATARTNLGLGTAATADTGTNDGDVPVFATGLLSIGGRRISGVNTPTDSTDAANKAYVDQLVQGLSWQQPVKGILTSPPGTPSDGDRYIVGLEASGAWTDSDDKIAVYSEDLTDWDYITPESGWAVWDKDTDSLYVYTIDGWITFGHAITHDADAIVSGVFHVDRIPELPQSKITGLVAALAGKADSSHNHAGEDITSGTVNAARLPVAGAESSGIITDQEQTIGGQKTFEESLIAPGIASDSTGSSYISLDSEFVSISTQGSTIDLNVGADAQFSFNDSGVFNLNGGSIKDAVIDCGTY